jgi:hypothetical protein
MKIPVTVSLIAAGLLTIAITAQANERSCRIVFPERAQDAPKTAYLFDGSKSRAVGLPSMNLSEVIELPDGEITIALTPDEISDPELLPPNAPLLKIPETARDFYIVIIPDPENLDFPIKMAILNTGEDELSAGKTFWHNLTEHRIFVTLGDEELEIDPKSGSVSKEAVPASGYYNTTFVYQARDSGELVPITEQQWWHDAGSRHLGFVIDSGGRLPKIHFYRDFRAPEPVGP